MASLYCVYDLIGGVVVYKRGFTGRLAALAFRAARRQWGAVGGVVILRGQGPVAWIVEWGM